MALFFLRLYSSENVIHSHPFFPSLHPIDSILFHKEKQRKYGITNCVEDEGWRAHIRWMPSVGFAPAMCPAHMREPVFPISKKDIMYGFIRVTWDARQQSLISNALFVTFATMRYYQKGLDFPGVTFRPWVRYINITRCKWGPISSLPSWKC